MDPEKETIQVCLRNDELQSVNIKRHLFHFSKKRKIDLHFHFRSIFWVSFQLIHGILMFAATI